jgi:hypothetical protein
MKQDYNAFAPRRATIRLVSAFPHFASNAVIVHVDRPEKHMSAIPTHQEF